jgi:hypothetical protein
MLMKKWIGLAAAVSMALLTACNQTNQPAKTENKPATTQEGVRVDVKEQQKWTAAYKKLDGEFNKDKPDFGVIRSIYDQELRPAIHGSYQEIDQLIDSYINAGQSGQAKPGESKQVVLKSLQRFFYEEIKKNVKEKIPAAFAKKEEAAGILAQAKVLYDDVLKGTVEKRDKAYKTMMVAELDTAFAEAEKAIQSQDKLAFLLQKQAIDKTFIRVFYLAVDHYAEETAEAVKKEPEEAKMEQLEGYAFYQAIKKSLAEADDKAAESVDMAFAPNSDPKNLNPKKVKQALVQALSAKAEGYIAKVLGEDWNNREEATEHAFEGNMFLKVIEFDMEKALGKAEKDKVFQSATQFLEAARKGDRAAAEKEAKVLRNALEGTRAHFEK